MNPLFKKIFSILLIVSFTVQSMYAVGVVDTFNLSPKTQINKALSSLESKEIMPLSEKEIQTIAKEYLSKVREKYEKEYSAWQQATTPLNDAEKIKIIQDLKRYMNKKKQEDLKKFNIRVEQMKKNFLNFQPISIKVNKFVRWVFVFSGFYLGFETLFFFPFSILFQLADFKIIAVFLLPFSWLVSFFIFGMVLYYLPSILLSIPLGLINAFKFIFFQMKKMFIIFPKIIHKEIERLTVEFNEQGSQKKYQAALDYIKDKENILLENFSLLYHQAFLTNDRLINWLGLVFEEDFSIEKFKQTITEINANSINEKNIIRPEPLISLKEIEAKVKECDQKLIEILKQYNLKENMLISDFYDVVTIKNWRVKEFIAIDYKNFSLQSIVENWKNNFEKKELRIIRSEKWIDAFEEFLIDSWQEKSKDAYTYETQYAYISKEIPREPGYDVDYNNNPLEPQYEQIFGVDEDATRNAKYKAEEEHRVALKRLRDSYDQLKPLLYNFNQNKDISSLIPLWKFLNLYESYNNFNIAPSSFRDLLYEIKSTLNDSIFTIEEVDLKHPSNQGFNSAA